MLILNLQSSYGVPNIHTDALLSLLKTKILPVDNTLPTTYGEAKKILTEVGMEYNIIHCCRNGCCLFRNDLVDASHCPICEEARYRDDTIGLKIPKKVMRHFPIIPRLRHLYGQKKTCRNDDLAFEKHIKGWDSLIRA